MKRSELKRTTPLKRTSPLARATAPLPRSQGLGRGNGRAGGSDAQNGSNGPKRKAAIPQDIRSHVERREQGRCSRCREKPGRGMFERAIHHVLSERAFPEHATTAANLILLCASCHADHEFGARDDSRLSMADDLPDDTLTWLGEIADGPILNYLDRTYRL